VEDGWRGCIWQRQLQSQVIKVKVKNEEVMGAGYKPILFYWKFPAPSDNYLTFSESHGNIVCTVCANVYNLGSIYAHWPITHSFHRPKKRLIKLSI
jgi:hypothetical protein